MQKCAAIQMASSPNLEANLIEAERLIRAAAEAGAELLVLPENFALMGLTEFDKLDHGETDGDGVIQKFLAQLARRFSVWIVGGTIPIKASVARKVRAACLVFDDRGTRVARYDKIHLFDVKVPGTDEQYRESDTIEAGRQPLVVDTPFGRLGLAICYDLRFPELFRTMLADGVDLIAIPSAFTAKTGLAHWEVLVRARAVENLCYVIAPNQGGFHLNGRQTYGRSMIVDPWGRVVAEMASGPGSVTAEIDPEMLARVRGSFPVLEHRRLVCR
ncbi:MAG: carbon-nitrogen hydrolase family protein [Methylococcaceae bacterium]|nr:carbon-nitrogen hydrolase family protein [Methylococcaceae bacterium]MCI0734642.1 carbon-nitrogen hydrolase family protein [Methylococcaceae bacterium]